jgi:hypothetical protein
MGRRLKTYGLGCNVGTVAATSATSGYGIVPKSGTIKAGFFSSVDALARHASNYVTFSITNLGQAGAGSTAILATDDGNTTKTTTGVAIVANGKFTLVLHGTAANLAVVEGDRLQFTVTAAGTSANTNTFSHFMLLIDANGA